MLQITLAQKAYATPFAEMSEAQLFRAATESWVLNPARARKEPYAIIIAEGAYVMGIQIDDIVAAHGAPTDGSKDDRYNLVGTVLRSGHPVHDSYVGKPAAGTRNPVRYPESPFDLTECRCGCGVEVKGDFLPGHDQRAIHERIARFGSVAKFLDWFDATVNGS